MAVLEYRLMTGEEKFRTLATYDRIEKEEVLLRFACNYLVKGAKVYETVACGVEADLHLIYVKWNPEETVIDLRVVFAPDWEGIRVEVRRFHEKWTEYPLVSRMHFHDPLDAVLQLQSHFLHVKGEEWEKISSEVDENRKVYVIYAQPTSAGNDV
jgi:hypothetical protein